MKTWRDLEELSLTDPFVHRAMHLHLSHPRTYSREEMLIDLVCALSSDRLRLMGDVLEARMNERTHPIGV